MKNIAVLLIVQALGFSAFAQLSLPAGAIKRCEGKIGGNKLVVVIRGLGDKEVIDVKRIDTKAVEKAISKASIEDLRPSEHPEGGMYGYYVNSDVRLFIDSVRSDQSEDIPNAQGGCFLVPEDGRLQILKGSEAGVTNVTCVALGCP